MPDYSEPVFSTGACADELSARGQAEGWADRYAKAHAEADAAEVDILRALVATAELSPAEFRELVRAECPGRRWRCEAWAYLYSDDYGPGADQCRYHATVFAGPEDRKGVPLKAESLRDLARLMREMHEHMTRMGTVNVLSVG